MKYIIKSGERTIYYNREIGRKRLYRMSVKAKNMRVLTFKNMFNAKDVCSHINETYSDNFKVESVE